LNSVGSFTALKPCVPGPPSSERILASSSLVRIGEGSASCRQDSGPGSSRLPSGPIEVSEDMMISSRMASTGGLVTWAKSCLK